MKTKEVLIAVISGCFGAVLTIIVGLFTPMGVVAQSQPTDAAFDKITCRKIEVVDEKSGKVMARMGTNDAGGMVNLFNKAGTPSAIMATTEQGGTINLSGKDAKGGVLIYITQHGGHVNVFGKDGGSAIVTTDKHGGRVVVLNKQGKGRAVMGVNSGFSYWDEDNNRHNVR